MKPIITILLSGFLFVSTFAQTVTIAFRGNNQNRNYRVLIDGSSYNSSNATSTTNNNGNGNGAGYQKTITVNNLLPGSHTIAVYNNTNTTGKGSLVYSNSFQLRSDYDMVIAVNAGRISFSEKTAEVADVAKS